MAPQTFRAPDVLTALSIVQNELGPEALVLSVREVTDGPAWKVWQQPQVEVLAMNPEKVTTPPAAPKNGQGQSQVDPEKDNVTSISYADLWKSLPVNQEEEPGFKPKISKLSRPLLEAQKQLLFQGLDKELVNKIISTCQQTLNPTALADDYRVQKHLIGQIAASLRTVRESKIGANNVIFLLGTSGAGKTSTIAKLADYFKNTIKRQVTWVCADTVPAGAIAEARAYTDSLNIPLALAYSPEDLTKINVQDGKNDHLMLVDMPNTNPRREEDLIAAGEFLTALPYRDTYLVIPATAKDVDLQQLTAAYSAFEINGLIITKLDESETVGSIINTSWRSRLPLAFYTSGPQVIDELEPARPNRLVERIFS